MRQRRLFSSSTATLEDVLERVVSVHVGRRRDAPELRVEVRRTRCGWVIWCAMGVLWERPFLRAGVRQPGRWSYPPPPHRKSPGAQTDGLTTQSFLAGVTYADVGEAVEVARSLCSPWAGGEEIGWLPHPVWLCQTPEG